METLNACILALAVVTIGEVLRQRRIRRRRRVRAHRWWVRPWIRERLIDNQVNTTYKLQRQLALEFTRMLRMPPYMFDFLLGRIRHAIQRQDTNYHKSISPEERLSLTLKYLATGESPLSLSEGYRVGRSTAGRIIKDTCLAIVECLQPEFLKTPSTVAEWRAVANQFRTRWNYVSCLGAIDGKHVKIMKPWNSGSIYFNYKHFFSIVLMAVVDANYEFLYCDVGAEGQSADGGTWNACDLHKAMDNGDVQFPPDLQLTEDISLPMHFIADDAFPMSERIIKPFSHRHLTQRQIIFNYRLSRARRVVENAFGIISSRFRVLRGEIQMNVADATNVVLSICVLHNMLRRKCGNAYMPPGTYDSEDADHNIIGGDWRHDETMPGLSAQQGRNFSYRAKRMREDMSHYFLSDEGEVQWQYARVRNQVVDILDTLE